MSAVTMGQMQRGKFSAKRCPRVDFGLLPVVSVLLAIGLVMVSSASITLADRELGNPFYFLMRQSAYLLIGLLAGVALFQVRIAHWSRAGMVCLALALVMLMLVLLPGIGKSVNGSSRWISLGIANLQVSEPAKLLTLIYLAGYLVRRGEEVRTQFSGFLKPMAVLSVICILLLAEPDFGASVVLLVTALGMMFLAGVRWWQFSLLLALASMAMGLLAIASPYRLARLTSFLNPWADPYSGGYQLTQSLIAIGRGEWLGVGLGASVQKLFYLPEAHTDFVFAVLAEEFGLLGVLLVIFLYGFLVWRAFNIGTVAQQAGEHFAAYLAYGIGIWMGLQSLINIGVNMGLLPTKGLTLPLLSYGGSSLLVSCAAIALLLRIDYETRCTIYGLPEKSPGPKKRLGSAR